MGLRQHTGPLLAAVIAAPLALAGCTGKDLVPGVKPAAPDVAVSPATGGQKVPISAEIGTKVTHGKVAAVTVTDAAGAKLDGTMRPDGSAWVPSKPLKYKQRYSATVTARNDSGQSSTATTQFTTMNKPDKSTTTFSYLRTGEAYGVAMPVAVSFDPPVPKAQRAAVQNRLWVDTTPSQPGVWSWVPDGSQVYYRAQDYWKPGTKISMRAGLAGLPMGNGQYGDKDWTASASVVQHPVFLSIDDRTHQMTVTRDDKTLKKIPVSLGKSSTPTSSGKMVIMEKFNSTIFDTRGEPDGGYVVQVNDAQRLTNGGEFIHAAPWSTGDQGYDNVSHGCTNVSDEDANYLMKVTHVGDQVTIKGTGTKLTQGNGWTAWDLSWPEYVKGSALPVPSELAAVHKPAPPKATTPPPAAAERSGVPATPANNGR
ncbi:L,D-transpeptidase [Rhizomonospora bruguierae]|uniref:L,D-transpeptidase n=1 Tax=Rhizomonospora bruguierae TaxID=1581705 RepID=UPI001BCF0993|nr:Ig-like domain-containing protein [Micromonospora sp. NBRC 107566]